MNKNTKRIIVAIIIINVFNIFVPRNHFNLINKKTVYASEVNNDILISLRTPFFIGRNFGQDDNIFLNQSFSDRNLYNITVSKLLDKVTLKCICNKENSKIIIDGQTVTENSIKNRIYEKQVILGKNKNIFNIRFENKNGTVNNYKAAIYKKDDLKFNKTEDIKLKNIILNDGNIEFKLDASKKDNYYYLDLDKSIKSILIKVEPENLKDIVRINGVIIDPTFEREIYLDLELKEIEIEVQDSKNINCRNTYVLNMKPKYDQWFNEDGNLYRYDSNGKLIMNDWYIERINLNKNWYYLGENGIALKEWLYNNKKWYHFGDDGIMEKGWKYINGLWYYFNEDGAMKTGWLKYNGTWYYLQSSGAMKIGWLNDNGLWYYMSSLGAMKIGWLKDKDNIWYYLNTDGAMVKSSVVDSYVLGSNGVWIK
ncbi:N-acetylmuramoyl-L-alanine amidase family protein [Clostridium weizhouense]|uniref:Cadherin-like beta sandwich domain-containing protein n=1 Tax=Clostridium weizhouense TaxID=2859781 RepID=A0ABS7ALE4_9CLOT|nr:N-acetylmuramoyl-L-alanine amidase family protein [Clostridium weizhouense]MBW6409480.1 cadherin-like beta sandwich domain-containing protein [Clostridium weizhouense]